MMKKTIRIFQTKAVFALYCVVLFACNGSEKKAEQSSDSQLVDSQMYFEKLPSSLTQIDFKNSITETENQNYYNFEYMYNGGGVAVGDINNDGLLDLFFTGNQVSDKLYLNKGGMVFEDITESAFDIDLAAGWHTGANMVDINADGWLDIYVCQSGNTMRRSEMKNLLLLNNKDNTFTESAEAYGISCDKRSVHSAFFDFDNDGDLDLYIMNHPLADNDKYYSYEELKNKAYEGVDSDVFYRNDNGVFKDVSDEVGIESNSYGLGLAIGDINNDNYLDIYISSDYKEPDFLFINNGDGSFREELLTRTNHTSNFSMGNDIADINNDGFLDIVTLDMASEDHVRSKRNMGSMSRTEFLKGVNMGFHHQYMFNCLQLNNGNGTFSDIGQLAGISKTDWSWAVLLADYNNDGKKDMFITNGFKREVRDNDYARNYQEKKANNELADFKSELELIPVTKTLNYIFENKGGLKFQKVTSDWGLDEPSNSNGASYADLDNDGDLDLIVNNIDETSFIYENKLEGNSNYIRVDVGGYSGNSSAIGAKVTLHLKEDILYQEVQPSRGYISCVEPYLHFGIGKSERVEKMSILWPDGTSLQIYNPQINTLIKVNYEEGRKSELVTTKNTPLFEDISDSIFRHIHKEIAFNDFETEVLLPNQMSQLGPFIAKGDINGDGMEDLYITGPRQGTGKMYLQNKKGFTIKNGPWQKEVEREEMDAEFLDVDSDGDLDLYVVSGGNEHYHTSNLLMDQLYINDGQGNFVNESNRLPEMINSGQSITSGDFDGDGDLDLFVGGRQVPGYYPLPPQSYLLENENGFFTNVTQKSKDLVNIGMITDALFDDFDADNDLDLIIVGEWMPVLFFENKNGIFTNVTNSLNPKQDVGWYYSIEKGDLNKDGKMDYIVGNIGENNKFHPTDKKPLDLYYNDFDQNGRNDIVLAKHQDGLCYPVRGRQCSSEQMPYIAEKFPTYYDFAVADISEIYGDKNLENSLHLSATNFSSVVFLSQKTGFEIRRLPVFCQFGPVNKSIIDDFNGDGNLDVLTVGNNFGVEVETIRYDAGRGVLLLGNGKGDLEQLSPMESGFFENNDCKDMTLVKVGEHKIIVTVSNNAAAKTFLLLRD